MPKKARQSDRWYNDTVGKDLKNFIQNNPKYDKNDTKMTRALSIIRHPSRDGELEKFPIDKIRDLAVQCYFIIDRPTEQLAQIFKQTHFSLNVHEWVQCYKLARFEKMMEMKRKGEI